MADDPPEDEDAAGPPVEFDTEAHLSKLLSAQHSAPSDLVRHWDEAGRFFYERYGLIKMSTNLSSKPDVFSTLFGAKRSPSSSSLVELRDHIMKGAWPPGICDLSSDIVHNHLLLAPPAHAALRVSTVSNPAGYLITIGRDVKWKLLIRDPLTLLQIERAELYRDPDSLIFNLVKKGIPFQVLNSQKPKGDQFYDHPGPVVHPIGKKPQLVDYLAYRHELAAFFTHYPHAYAAALSAGGILWRIAMDVLPPPNEYDLVRQFHPNGCFSTTINGEKYWTPRLTQSEEDVIAGVYRWPVCKSAYSNCLDSLGSWLPASEDSPQENSWWPKRQVWDDSGLDFGAWAPVNENWYTARNDAIRAQQAECVRSRSWKSKVKYGGKGTVEFLQKVRGLTRAFVGDYQL